eukprot:COSAG02_NODE_10919_length_1831_cov_3.854503_1_plen_24_part_10
MLGAGMGDMVMDDDIAAAGRTGDA